MRATDLHTYPIENMGIGVAGHGASALVSPRDRHRQTRQPFFAGPYGMLFNPPNIGTLFGPGTT